jgi:hypothetical protein
MVPPVSPGRLLPRPPYQWTSTRTNGQLVCSKASKLITIETTWTVSQLHSVLVSKVRTVTNLVFA